MADIWDGICIIMEYQAQKVYKGETNQISVFEVHVFVIWQQETLT
jgi:hypothetical protein